MRLKLVEEQLVELDKKKQSAIENPVSDSDWKVADLLKLKGVGVVSAWVLGKEFFGWRGFRNRREVASLAGLTPTPYDSGSSRVEQRGAARPVTLLEPLRWEALRAGVLLRSATTLRERGFDLRL